MLGVSNPPSDVQNATTPAAVDIVILDVTASPAGGIAVSTRVTYQNGNSSGAPAVRPHMTCGCSARHRWAAGLLVAVMLHVNTQKGFRARHLV